MRVSSLHLLLSLCALNVAAVAVHADSVAQYNVGKEKLAVEGYDLVSYFGGRAVKGKAQFATEHKGIKYWFSSAENRDKFTSNPATYLPAYGGWCATAMAEGKKVEIDPRNFRIRDGRLFLFYKNLFVDAQNDWKKD